MTNELTKQLLDALIELLDCTRIGGDISSAQAAADAAILAAKPPVAEEHIALTLHKHDPDTAKIVRGKQLVGYVIRSLSGRWQLADLQQKPVSKVEYSTPKKAFAFFEDNFK